MSDDDTDDSEYVVSSRRSWGRGDNAQDALQTMASHFRPPDGVNETEELLVAHVRGFEGTKYFRVYADEFISEEKLEVDGEKLRELREKVNDAERFADGLLADATVVEETDH